MCPVIVLLGGFPKRMDLGVRNIFLILSRMVHDSYRPRCLGERLIHYIQWIPEGIQA